MVVRLMMLLCAGAAAIGAAFGAPAPQPRVGAGTMSAAPAPRMRGGPGTLGGYLGRRPSRGGVRRVYPFYPGFSGFYGSRFYDGFYYDPFFYDPFAIGPWGSYYETRYRSEDDWSKRGNVQLQVEPRDVEVTVDGIPSAKGGRAVLSLPTGMHHIELTRAGYRPWTLDLDVKQGVRYRLEQHLERLPKGEAPAGAGRTSTAAADRRQVGELRLDVRPADAIVDLDGRLLGMADLLRQSAALRRIHLGHHRLRFSRPGYKTIEREIDVTAAAPADVTVELERE